MGEIADDMIEGCSCSMCGCYFIDKKDEDYLYKHGYPVACTECWSKGCGYPKQNREAVAL